MGSASKVTSVVLRVWELICSCVVVGIIGTYLHYLGNAHVTSSRMDYVIATASISLVGSLALAPPLRYSFYAFPFDFVMFVMWMVAFGLMIDVCATIDLVFIEDSSIGKLTTTTAYWDGRVQLNLALVGTTACGQWRATVAFAFMGGWTWLISMCLGIYVAWQVRNETKTNAHGNTAGPITYAMDPKMETVDAQA